LDSQASSAPYGDEDYRLSGDELAFKGKEATVTVR